jgi:hypothetical protein
MRSLKQNRSPFWPAPDYAAFPVEVKCGRTFGPFAHGQLAGTIGWLMANTLADAIRLRLSASGQHRWVEIMGAACPAVPYATLGSDDFVPFLEYAEAVDLTVWVHRRGFFWIHDLDDDAFEATIDAFITARSANAEQQEA